MAATGMCQAEQSLLQQGIPSRLVPRSGVGPVVAKADVEALKGGAEGTMAQEEGPGKPLEALGSTLRW